MSKMPRSHGSILYIWVRFRIRFLNIVNVQCKTHTEQKYQTVRDNIFQSSSTCLCWILMESAKRQAGRYILNYTDLTLLILPHTYFYLPEQVTVEAGLKFSTIFTMWIGEVKVTRVVIIIKGLYTLVKIMHFQQFPLQLVVWHCY